MLRTSGCCSWQGSGRPSWGLRRSSGWGRMRCWMGQWLKGLTGVEARLMQRLEKMFYSLELIAQQVSENEQRVACLEGEWAAWRETLEIGLIPAPSAGAAGAAGARRGLKKGKRATRKR